MKKRMYSNIIVVGGGLMFPGFQSWLHHLLWIHMPANIKSSIEAVDIITRSKVSHLNSRVIYLNMRLYDVLVDKSEVTNYLGRCIHMHANEKLCNRVIAMTFN